MIGLILAKFFRGIKGVVAKAESVFGLMQINGEAKALSRVV